MFLLVSYLDLNLAKSKAWVKENFHYFKLYHHFVHSSCDLPVHVPVGEIFLFKPGATKGVGQGKFP
jgi:hypothetical protein